MPFVIRSSSGLLQVSGSTAPRITTDAATYAVGDTVTATVTNGPAGVTNAVGLYHSDDDPATAMPVDWKYLATNSKTQGTGVASGSVTFSLTGLAPDSYDVVLVDAPFIQNVAGTYFVSSTGNDSLDGHSTVNAWRTIAKVNAYAAATHFLPNDQILFEGGQTFSGGLVFTAASWVGAIGSTHVTIGSYGTGRATISSGALSGLSITNNSGVLVQELNFVGNGAADVDGVIVYNGLAGTGKLPYVYLYNLDITGYGRNGVAVLGGYGPAGNNLADTAGFDEVTIDGVVVHGCTNMYAGNAGSAGIRVQGVYGFNSNPTAPTHTNVVVTNCQAYSNLGRAGASDWTGSGIFVGYGVQSGTIEYCVAHDNGANNNLSTSGPVGIWSRDSDGIVIQYNESYGNKTATIGGGGFALDAGMTDSTLQYNYSHDNDGPAFLLYNYADTGFIDNWDNNTCRYNISENDCARNAANYGAVHINSNGVALTNVLVYNNTIYISRASSSLVMVRGAVTNGLVANNIFYLNVGSYVLDAGTTSPAGLLFRGNDYFATGTFAIRWNNVTYSTLAAFQTGTGQEIRNAVPLGTSANPLLNDPGNGGTVGGLLEIDPDTGKILPPKLPAYQLQATSTTMIDHGLNLLKLFSVNPGGQDFYLTPLPQGFTWDIGACESLSIAAQVSEFNEDWSGVDDAHWDFAQWPLQEWYGDASSITIQANAGRMTVGGQASVWAHASSIVNAMADFDLRVTVQMESVGEQYYALHCRASSGTPNPVWSTDPFRPVNGYEIRINQTQLVFCVIQNDVRGTDTPVSKTWGTNLWNIHVQMIGSAIKVRAWLATVAEPGTWDIQVTNGTFASGYFLMGANNGNDGATRSATWDTLSITAPVTQVATFFDDFSGTGTWGTSWNPDKWPTQFTDGSGSAVSIRSPGVGELLTGGMVNAWARASSNCTNMGDFNLTCTIRMQFFVPQYHFIFVRSGGGWSTVERWRPTEALEIRIWTDGNTTNSVAMRFIPILDDVYHTNSQVIAEIPDLGTTDTNLRIQMIGPALRVKLWKGSPEPTGWNISTSYNPTPDGKFITGTLRVSSASGDTTAQSNIKFDNMSVTTFLPPTTGPINFDGSTYLIRGGNLTNLVDGKIFLVSLFFRVLGSTNSERRILTIKAGSSTRLAIGLDTSNGFFVLARDSSGNDFFTAATTAAYTSTVWHHALVSVDLNNTANRAIYIDGVAAAVGSWAPYTAGAVIDFAGATQEVVIGSYGDTAFWNGDIANLFFHTPAAYVAPATVLAAFMSPSGLPVDMGATGSLPLGVQPILCMSRNWPNNDGSGGNFTVGGGALVAGAVPIDV